jgi:hypothetical protein
MSFNIHHLLPDQYKSTLKTSGLLTLKTESLIFTIKSRNFHPTVLPNHVWNTVLLVGNTVFLTAYINNWIVSIHPLGATALGELWPPLLNRVMHTNTNIYGNLCHSSMRSWYVSFLCYSLEHDTPSFCFYEILHCCWVVKFSDYVISNGNNTSNGSNPSLLTVQKNTYNFALFKIKGILFHFCISSYK